MQQLPQVDSKKPYQKPSVRVYGNVETLTATVSNTASPDGGGSGMFRTH